jgi:hypothetical protein
MANLLPNAKQQFFGPNGVPLSGGSVYYYIPNTTTFKATYQDQAQTILNSNPVILDANGECVVWGTGAYRQQVFDVNGNLIWDQVTQDPQAALTGNITDKKYAAGTDFTPGTTTTLTLPTAPGSVSNMWVFFDAAFQADDQFSVNGTTLTFNSPIPVGTQEVNVKIGTTIAIGTPNSGTVTDASVATGTKLYNRIHDFVDVKDYGATGNGVTDDTTAIQAAINGAGVGGAIYFPPGTYLVSSTITCLNSQVIYGSGANQTVIQRNGNYGNTLSWSSAGAAQVRGLWFNHSQWYVQGEASLPNLATSGAHLYMPDAQQALIENCFFWRLPYGLELDGSSLTTIRNNWFQGVWDPANAGCQEGVACIWLNNQVANCEIIKIEGNYINGAKSAARNITYTASDGSQTVSRNQNIGPQFGILIAGCEDLLVEGNFIGAQYTAGLYSNFNAASTNLDWRIIGNFFDDGPSVSNGSSIYFNSQGASYFVNGVTIADNVFNGELQGINAIVAFNGGAPGNSVLNNFSITGNTFLAHVGCPIALYAATTGTVVGNTVTAYNAINTSPGNDPTFCAGVGLFGTAQDILVHSNTIGGQVNSGLPGGFTYQGVSNTSSSAGQNVIRDNMMVGIGLSVNQIGLQDSIPTQLTTAGNYQATSSDQVVCARAIQTGAWSFGLPLNPPPGRKITLKDAAGTAATYNVQVLGTVDGVTNPTYSTNFFTKTFYWNGVQWNVISN